MNVFKSVDLYIDWSLSTEVPVGRRVANHM